MPRINWHWIYKIAKGRGEWMTLLFSLLLALFIWTIHNLSLRYTAYLQYSVHVKTNIEGRALEADAEDAIMMRVRANGYTLLSHRMNDEIFLNLEPKFLRPITPDSDTFIVYVSEIKDVIEKQLIGDKISNVENYTTEMVRVILPSIDTKKVPVIAQTQLDFTSQYMAISDLKLNPDSLIIYGEDNIVENIDAVYTRIISHSGVSKGIQGVAYIIPIEGVVISEDYVYYSQEVGRYIEQNIELPLEIINVPRGKELLPFASSVKVVYRQLLDSHKPLDMSDFRCVLDYKDIESSINSQAVPRLEKAPQGIYSVSFDPPYVDCIVLDKQ
jgi:hypothetical protein